MLAEPRKYNGAVDRGAYQRTFDAVEEENLKHHDERDDGVQVNDDESLKPIFSKEVANY